tara:strand:+ start:308 stop:703 length:396 start_codon:yes stop_codon:yes gene_type:complete
MKNFLLTVLLISLTSLNASEVMVTKDSLTLSLIENSYLSLEEKALIAIKSENYVYIESAINQGLLNPKTVVNGKPLIIHAAIHDKPEMILLLASYGAMIIDPVCEEGKNIMEYAQESNSILAQAQIILIRA